MRSQEQQHPAPLHAPSLRSPRSRSPAAASLAFIACIAHKQHAAALRATSLQIDGFYRGKPKTEKSRRRAPGGDHHPPLSGLGEPPARSGGGERTRARAKCFYKIILSWGCSSEVHLPPYAFCEILEEILFSKSLKKNDRFRRATKTSSVLKGGKKRGGQGCQGFNINCDTESVKRGVAPLPRSVSGVFGAQKCLF